MSIELHLGDCLDVMREMPDGSVDAVITDPPYGTKVAEWDKAAPYEVLPELLRVSKGLVLWFGAAPRLREDLLAFEIPPQRVLIWHVTFSLAGTAAHGMYYRYHPLYAWKLPKKQKGLCQDVVQVPQDGHNGWYHPGTKPIKLMTQLVQMVDSGATILDPYMGSGTTMVACINTDHNGIGIEINPNYFAIAQRRVADAQQQLRLEI